MHAGAVREILGLDDTYRPWTEALESTAPAPRIWPPVIDLNSPASDRPNTLDRLGVPHGERPQINEALAGLDQHPAYRWLLERAAGRMVESMGSAEPFDPGAALPSALGPTAQWFHVAVFLACLPKVRAHHAGLGIPENISWAGLADLGNKIDVQRRLAGTGGCRQHMVQLAFRGILFRLGRLQFNLTWHAGHTPGVAVHIPETGPLSPRACQGSYTHATQFFPRYFPTFAPGALVMSCHSWLLDPQLEHYLPPGANILQFQRRYTLTDASPEPVDAHGLTAGDRSVVEFVFREPLLGLDGLRALQPRTTLERAIVTHLQAGRHWQVREGMLTMAGH